MNTHKHNSGYKYLIKIFDSREMKIKIYDNQNKSKVLNALSYRPVYASNIVITSNVKRPDLTSHGL